MESSLLPVITGIPTEEAIDPYEVMGMDVMATRLLRNQTTGEMLDRHPGLLQRDHGPGIQPRSR